MSDMNINIVQARQGGQLCERDTCSDDSIKVENKFRFEQDKILFGNILKIYARKILSHLRHSLTNIF